MSNQNDNGGDNGEEENNGDTTIPAFDFTVWAADAGLNRKTTGAMRIEDFDNEHTLEVMNNEDIAHLGISRGQQGLLRRALANLSGSTFNVTATVSSQQVPPQMAGNSASGPSKTKGLSEGVSQAQNKTELENMAIMRSGLEYDNLFGGSGACNSMGAAAISSGIDGGNGANSGSTNQPNWYNPDPRQGLVVKARANKSLKIVDYLPAQARDRLQKKQRESMRMTLGNDGNYVLRVDDGQSQGQVNMGQWISANMRVMAHLMELGHLRRDDVEYYMAYTAYIGDLVERYEWFSIMEYDTQYREMQAEHGFMWGHIPTHLAVHILRARQPLGVNRGGGYGGGGGPRRPYGDSRGTPSSGHQSTNSRPDIRRMEPRAENNEQQVCRIFANRGSCPYGLACKFVHPPQPKPE